MKILLHSASDLTLFDLGSPGFEVGSAGASIPFSGLQMFATSIGLCTASVLASYGEQIKVPIDRMAVRVQWAYEDRPFRVGSISLSIHWPELPASRRTAAERAAGHCTLHHTLEHPPRVTTTVTLTPSREAEAEMAGARSPAPQG